MPNVDCFEKHINKYEKWFEQNRLAYESELEAIKMLIPRDKVGLEVGVGTGRFAEPLGIRVGVDPSHVMSDLAMYRGIDVYQAFGENLPFDDNSFSFVLFVTTVCFLEDFPAALKEAYRVLEPGGHIIIGFLNRESPIGQLYIKNKLKNIFYRDAKFFSVNEIEEHLRVSGFSNFVYKQTLFQDPERMEKTDPVKPGYDKGSFIVIRGEKPIETSNKE